MTISLFSQMRTGVSAHWALDLSCHECIIPSKQNHRIFKIGKDLQDHRVQLLNMEITREPSQDMVICFRAHDKTCMTENTSSGV